MTVRQPFSPYLLTFFPLSLSVLPQGHNITINSVIGCIRDFKMNDVAIGEPKGSYKTLPCLDGLTEMGTYFGGGHIAFGLSNFMVPVELTSCWCMNLTHT